MAMEGDNFVRPTGACVCVSVCLSVSVCLCASHPRARRAARSARGGLAALRGHVGREGWERGKQL